MSTIKEIMGEMNREKVRNEFPNLFHGQNGYNVIKKLYFYGIFYAFDDLFSEQTHK